LDPPGAVIALANWMMGMLLAVPRSFTLASGGTLHKSPRAALAYE
jgi:hypothetical protein